MSVTAHHVGGAAPAKLGHFIAGQMVDEPGNTFENRNPATGEIVSIVSEADKDQVDRAVNAARKALKGPWGEMSVQDRSKLLRQVADEINNRFTEFLTAEILDTGKPISLASHLDIPRGAGNFDVFADLIVGASTEVFPMKTPDGGGALNYALRKPRGVIAIICPWNLPLLLMTWKVAPALASGNTVVVKPSEDTPTTATLLGEVMAKVGIPPGVFNVVNGKGAGSTGQFLTEHPLVDGITFTGETVTGEHIMRAAASGVRPVSLELGGKNAALIFDDCDLDKTIEGMSRAVFMNCGQICLGTERVYVQRGIFDQFAERLAASAAAMKLGDPFDEETNQGPVINSDQKAKVLDFYAAAKAEGASILVGGGVPTMSDDLAGGTWVEPTVWTGLAHDSVVMRKEIFGPCCNLVPFDTEEEAVFLANDSPYGLASSIWTEQLSRAHRVAGQIDVGIAWVNSWFLRDLRTPFGGAKHSGIGREGGVHGLDFYTELSNVCIRL